MIAKAHVSELKFKRADLQDDLCIEEEKIRRTLKEQKFGDPTNWNHIETLKGSLC